MWRFGDHGDKSAKKTSGVLGAPGKDAGPLPPEDLFVQLACQDSPLWWPKKRKEETGKQGPQGCHSRG